MRAQADCISEFRRACWEEKRRGYKRTRLNTVHKVGSGLGANDDVAGDNEDCQ